MKSDCSIDVKGYRFFTMERLFYALQLLSFGQLAKYSRMDYVRKSVNTCFELASRSLQDKWLDEQFQTWKQIITARILSDPVFSRLTSMWPRGVSVRDSAYISKKNVCTTKAAVLTVMDHTPHACHTWAGACLIGPETAALWYGTSRAGLLWQPVLALTKVHCWRVTIRSIFRGRGRFKLHDRQLGGIYYRHLDYHICELIHTDTRK